MSATYFAEVDDGRIVTTVQSIGADEADSLPGNLVQTWPDANGVPEKRFNYAGIGYTFEPSLGPIGAFVPSKPYPSWLLNPLNCQWIAPVPIPEDGGPYYWDEETLSYIAGVR